MLNNCFNLNCIIMKASVNKLRMLFTTLTLLSTTIIAFAQQNRVLQNFRYPDQRGINVFETPKEDTTEFNGINVRLGGAFALQYQAITHSNGISGAEPTLIDLANNFNLATANMNIDVQLAQGVRMHLNTYLSSRHHREAWVKGGYLQIDNADFIKKGFASSLMDIMTIKVGHMQNNYGDAHFRRSDNGMALYNPFVGNLIMDGFTTEVGGEAYFQKNGLVAVVGLTNGKLNQSPKSPGSTKAAFIGKIGYDNQLSDDFRLRVTSSIYTIAKASRIYLYSADRTGSRYYNVMEAIAADGKDDFRSGRWNPSFADKITAVMVNPFIKYKGLEFFGTYEVSTGGDAKGSTETRTWNQMAAEVLYRFGKAENLYLGTRYNTVSGKLAAADANEVSIDRLQVSAGWFLTKNILTKFEYVSQTYKDFDTTSKFNNGEFNGFMVEAVISF